MDNSIATDLSPVYPESEEDKLVDPNPQTELPNQMTNPLGDSMTQAYKADTIAAEKDLAQRKQQRMDDIYAATKNLDAWETHLSPEQKNRKIIKGLMGVQLGYVPKDVDAYEQARHEMAGKFFDGKGGESDEAMIGNITEQSLKRKEHEDIHSDLQEFAVVAASTGQSFGEWAVKNESVRTASRQRRASLMKSFKGYQADIEEQYGVATNAARNTFSLIKNQSPAAAVSYARSLGKDMSDDEIEAYLGLVQRAITDNPDKSVEEFVTELGLDEGFLKNTVKTVTSLAWQGLASRKGVKQIYGDAIRMTHEVGSGIKNVKDTMFAPITEKMGQDLSGDHGKLKRGNQLGNDLRQILASDYSVIEPVFKSGAMAAVERGVFQIPAAIATTATMVIPYVGLPATYAMVVGGEREKYRQRLLANGVGRDKAAEIAGDMGLVSAMPQMLLEKLQAGAFLGKFPMFDKLATKIANRFSSKLGRFSGRFGMAAVGEANIEYGQEMVSEVVQMMGASFKEEIPDVQWTGDGGVFDGWAYKYLETAVAVAPLGVLTATGGVKQDTRDLAFADTDSRIRGMYGVTKEDNERIDRATTVQEKIEAARIAKANADPHSDEAKALVEEEVERQREEAKSLANLQRAGLFPIIRADKKNEGVIEVVDPKTGEVLERVDNDPAAAAEATVAYMQLQDDATQAQLDELAGMVEVAMIDVKNAEGDQSVELDLGNNMDVKGLLEMFPEYSERVESQIDRLQQLSDKEVFDGGDGNMSRAVYGMNIHEHNGDQTKTTNRLFAGTSAMTIVHERGHSAWKRALDSGATTLAQTYDFFKQLDETLVGKKDRNGNDVRFLPEGTTAEDFVALDEAVAEFSEVMVLQTRKGKKTEMRDAVGRQMSAMVKARRANAAGFKGFVRAMQDYFGRALARHFFIKKAISSGMIKESDLNDFNAILQGSTEQQSFDNNATKQGEALKDEVSLSLGEIPKEIEDAKDPLVKHLFLKEDGKFYEKMKDGYVVVDQSLDQFEGMAIMLHQPDGAMAGTVEVDGEQVVAGKGGVYYPVMFGDQGYFWASTKDAAKGMAKNLNAISKRNNGTILMALTSAPIEKMFSSTTMSTGALDLFHTLAKNPKKYGVTKEELNKAIAIGSQATLVKEKKDEDTGEVTRTVKQFPHQLKETDSLAKNLKEMKKNLLPEASIFGQRGAFVQHLAAAMADHMKLPNQTEVKKLNAKDKAAYEVKKQQALNIANLLAGEKNLYNKSDIPKGILKKASVMQGMADLFAEPLVKTFQDIKGSQSGRIYAVLEMKGEVEAFATDDHESYPFALRSTSGQNPIVHVLENSNRWQDVVYAAPNKKNKKDKKEVQPLYDGNTNPVKKADESSMFPASAGVSMREMIVRKADEGAESIKLSFSIGDRQMNDTIINNAAMRMRDPAGVAIVMRAITKNMDALKREVPKVIKAFGKELTQEPIVDARMMGDLRTEAREMRRDALEAAENKIYDEHGDLLSNEDLTKLTTQPVTEFILAEGGMESTSGAKRRKGDAALKAGEYEEAGGLPSLYYGGSQSPDQMALQLYNDGVTKDPDVSTMMEAIEREMVSVSNRKSEMKTAQKKMKAARGKARKDAEEWLNERIAEQERDYSYKARATRALQKLSAIRRALPMELRGKIVGDAKLLSMGDEARLKYLEKTVAKVDKEIDKWVRQHADKAITKAYKILGKKKLSPETEAELKTIKALGKMTALQVNEAMRKLHEMLEDPKVTEGAVEDIHLQISELGTYGNQSDMSAAMRINLLEALNVIIKRGKTIRAVKAQERAIENAANQEMVIDVVSGGKGKMSRPQSARQREKLRKDVNSFLKSSQNTSKTFHGKNLAFEGLLNMLSRLDTGSGTYQSRISKKFQEMVHNATRMNKRLDWRSTDAYNKKMREIFGFKGVRLTNKIHDHFMVTDPKGTGIDILKYEGDSSVESKSIPLEKAKLLAAGELDLGAHGLNARDAEQIKEAYNAMIANPKSKLTNKTKVKWEHEKTGKPEALVVSQGTAISLIMMYRQAEIKKSMIREGYTEEAMEKLENEFLTGESQQALEWLAEQYEANYEVVNAVYRQQHGVDLPKIDFYAPVRRVADTRVDDLELGGSASNFGSSPAMLMERVSNLNQVDQSVNALTLYNEHMTASNHYVSWSDTIRQMRDTFNQKDVRKAIEDYVSPEVYKLLNERIQWMADGGNRKKDRGVILDKMRMAHTFSSLAYDLGIMIKQFSSLPAYAFDMGMRNWLKYQTQFFKNPIENAKSMIETEYVQLRFKDGYSRDVAEGLKLQGGNKYQNWLLAGFKAGMMVGKVGDIVPVIAGGWAVRQHAYDKARKTMSREDAMTRATLEFEMATDRSQQAVDMKDLSSYSGGGSIAKLFTMYKTSPRQYYAVAYEALLDAKAGRGSKKDAVRKMLIAHTVLPVVFQFISDSWKMIGDDDKEYEWEDYVRAMLLGPINGLFIAGEAASPIAALIAGSDVYEPRMPVYQSGSKLIRAVKNYGRRDFWENVHETADALGKFSPDKVTDIFTYYSIISKQSKNLLGRSGLFD